MTPRQFAFSDQLCTTFARKMTFATLKIAFNICARVKRHVHVRPTTGPGATARRQQHVKQCYSVDLSTADDMQMY